MNSLPDPTPELKEFMRKGSLELFEIMMKFMNDKVNLLPDDPKIVHAAISSIACASIAYFLGYKFSNMIKEDILEGSLIFCDGILKNLEVLIDKEDFYKIMGKTDEMD